jgi:hypothetical protein
MILFNELLKRYYPSLLFVFKSEARKKISTPSIERNFLKKRIETNFLSCIRLIASQNNSFMYTMWQLFCTVRDCGLSLVGPLTEKKTWSLLK